MRHLFVVDSLDKQMQKEKEPIRLASATKGVGGLFFVCGGNMVESGFWARIFLVNRQSRGKKLGEINLFFSSFWI